MTHTPPFALSGMLPCGAVFTGTPIFDALVAERRAVTAPVGERAEGEHEPGREPAPAADA